MQTEQNAEPASSCANFTNHSTAGSEAAIETSPSSVSVRGFCTAILAEMSADALLDEEALAGVLKVTSRTIRRMVGRGQLPPGVKLGARRIWMAGKVTQHLKYEADRLATAARRHSFHHDGSEV